MAERHPGDTRESRDPSFDEQANVEDVPRLRVGSPRLADLQRAGDFVMEVAGEIPAWSGADTMEQEVPMDATLKTTEPAPAIPPEKMADLEYAIQLLMTGRDDPEFRARLRAEAEAITEEVFRRFGPLDIAVPAIRALRDDG